MTGLSATALMEGEGRPSLGAWLKAQEVRRSDLNPGDRLMVDDSYQCLDPWTVHEVFRDGGGLYVRCGHGKHYLHDGGELIENRMRRLRRAHGG